MRIQKPLSAQELKTGDLISPGTYDFEVIDAQDATSKNGNEMIKLQVRIALPDGRFKIVFDYLLEALAYKLGHFCEATGLEKKYQSGEFEAYDCIGKKGRLKIAIQVDKSGTYADKSVISDYLPTDEFVAAKDAKVAGGIGTPAFDDELPF